MNLVESFQVAGNLETTVVRVALVLMHSLWQVLLVVNVAAILLAALGRARPNVRYLVALLGLLILPVFPLVTWFVVEPTPRQVDSPLTATSAADPDINVLRNTISPPETTFEKVTRLVTGIDRYCRQHAVWLAAAWGIGVAAFALRFAVAWLSVWKLHRTASEEVPHSVPETLHRVAKVMGMSSPIRLSVTDKIDGPAVVGWFRPLILLPAHMLTGLSTDDLTHILAHELAHVRRHDYAVNLVQCVIEMLFFHHPAVWWLSYQVREEREHCCDEIAIAACGDRFAYARSLATLDDMRPEPRPLVLALGTKGGRLMNRIRRLLGVPTPSIGGSGAVVLAGMVLVVVIALAMGSPDATAQTDDNTKEAKKEEAFRSEAERIALEAQEQIIRAEQAQVEAARAEQLARVAADLDKLAQAQTLEEKKFRIAELQLELEEAATLEAFANEEAAIVEKMMEAGQISNAKFLEGKQQQAAARLAKQKAELALQAIKTGQDPNKGVNELELESALLAMRAAEDALQIVEKHIAAGQAPAIERAAARREAAKAKFQVDRLRLRQARLKGQTDQRLAEEKEAMAARVNALNEALARTEKDLREAKSAEPQQPIAKVYKLKHAMAQGTRDAIKEYLDPKGARDIRIEADERSNSVIVVALQGIHQQISQLIAKLDGAEAEEGASDKADAIRSIKKRIEYARETQHQSEKAPPGLWKTKLEDKEAAEIDRATLIRRLSLDLRGTLPTPEEVKAFVNDKEPDAVRRLVGRLLEASDPHADKINKLWKSQKTPKTVQAKAQPSSDADAQIAANERQAMQDKANIEIQLLELDVRKAENDLAAAKAKLDRMTQLQEKKAVAEEEVIAAKIEAANCEIAVRRAKLTLDAAKLKLTPPETLKQPAEGTVETHRY